MTIDATDLEAISKRFARPSMDYAHAKMSFADLRAQEIEPSGRDSYSPTTKRGSKRNDRYGSLEGVARDPQKGSSLACRSMRGQLRRG